MILLSDANVLIDLGYVNGLSVLVQLGIIEVLDLVLLECDHPKQPNLLAQIEQSGIRAVATKAEWIEQVEPNRPSNLSLPDSLNLFYAKEFHRVLLTNEKPLRQYCQKHQVAVHGTLWIIEEAYQKNLQSPSQLCSWLQILSQRDRRLPKSEVFQLRQLLNCPP